jgi:hypothetical protein
MNRSLRIAIVLAGLMLTGAWSAAEACPGCVPTASETQAQIVARCDVVLLAQFVGSRAVDGEEAAFTEFEVATVGKDETKSFNVKQRVRLDRYYESATGDLFLLRATRSKEETLQWESAEAITETAYHYIMQAPSPEIPLHKRLPYYVKFFEFPDSTISNDAYNEFALAPFEDVATVADRLSREKLREWLWIEPGENKNGSITTRFGLYGILLGLCGNADDAEFLEELFFSQRDEYRIGMEGIVTGYLFLSGERGLRRIREQLIADSAATTDFLYPLLRAFRIVWTYGPHRVPREELVVATRTFLEHERMAELAVPDLSRWQDWESTDRLLRMYRQPPFSEDEGFRKAVVAYMAVCADATTERDGQTEPVPQAARAREFVADVRKDEPDLYRRAMISTGLLRRPRPPRGPDGPDKQDRQDAGPPAPPASPSP